MSYLKYYNNLFDSVYGLISTHKKNAIDILHHKLSTMYWEIGQSIVSYFQKHEIRSKYGEQIIKKLSCDLKATGHRGFSISNLKNMRLFFLQYPNATMLRIGITWSHYLRLLSLECDNSRRFYEEMILREKWSVRELEKQISTSLYERTLLHQETENSIVKKNRIKFLPKPTIEDSIKDPYILDFLDLEDNNYQESDLEKAIISNIENFLLELGYGFTFIWRQKRIQIGKQFYYIDLVFYHRGLRCLVLIDLKMGNFSYSDVGQMNTYLNYFKTNERYEGEEDPIGIILCANKDNELVRYALGDIKKKIFVSKYQTLLPSKEILQNRILVEKNRYYQYSLLENKLEKSKHPRKHILVQYAKNNIKITIDGYHTFANISKATANRDLAFALKEGWVERFGKTRSAYYKIKYNN